MVNPLDNAAFMANPTARGAESERVLEYKGLPLEILPAIVSPGERYWRVRRAVALNPYEGHGLHHLFVRCFRDGQRVTGIPVQLRWPGGSARGLTEAKPPGEFGDWNVPLYGDWIVEEGPGPYSVRIDDGVPSETFAGMGLPRKQHFSYVLEFEESVAGGGAPPPTPDEEPFPSLEEALRVAIMKHMDPLARAMAADGFFPISRPFVVEVQEQRFLALGGGRPGGEERIYYASDEAPSAISHIRLT